jgi:hypothetical protein
MKAVDFGLGPLDERELLRSAIGRPRTLLWFGTTGRESEAVELGARLLAHEESNESADLAFVDRTVPHERLSGLLVTAVPRLSEGGHVVVEYADASVDRRRVIADLCCAGLAPLWESASRGAPLSFCVARKRPPRRTLSLTVGMISMNEAGAVGDVIDDIQKHAPNAEILLVDSSKDETPQIAESKGARVLRQFPPRGYGPAMTRLLYSATTDVIVTMDCDGTYPASRIRDLHERIEQGADLVNASRTHHRPKAMPIANYVANRTFALVAGVVHQYWTTDLHSGMRAYRTSMLRGTYVPEKGPALPVELLLVPARHGYRVEDVNIDYFERIGTTTLHRWDSTVWTFRRIAAARARAGARVH